MKSCSLATSTATTVVERGKDLEGIASDPITIKIYYASSDFDNRMYRASIDASEIKTLRSNLYSQWLVGLAVGSRTGNLYVVSSLNSNVYVCGATSSDLGDTTLSTVGTYFSGIALDPLRGREVYISGLYGIYRAPMDGSGFTQLVSGYKAAGTQVDAHSDQLYWADKRDDRIVSSSRHGTGIDTPKVQLGAGDSPYGFTTFNGYICWGNLGSHTLLRNSPAGKDVVTMYNATSPIQHLTSN